MLYEAWLFQGMKVYNSLKEKDLLSVVALERTSEQIHKQRQQRAKNKRNADNVEYAGEKTGLWTPEQIELQNKQTEQLDNTILQRVDTKEQALDFIKSVTIKRCDELLKTNDKMRYHLETLPSQQDIWDCVCKYQYVISEPSKQKIRTNKQFNSLFE